MKTSLSYKFANVAKKAGYKFRSHTNTDVIAMRDEIAKLGTNGINFNISIERDGSWYAESTNVDGIISGGFDVKEINEMLKDAVFTYYGVAPQHCDDTLLKSSGEVQTVKQQVLVTM